MTEPGEGAGHGAHPRRDRGPAPGWRLLIGLGLNALALDLLDGLLAGFDLDGSVAALGLALLLGVLNAFVWPAAACS